ncbi:hypothetical protein V6N12_016262 [Hibiscus sabdariffa]|uniref:Protein kinase domain-containing protein n=1 Tax=Hibiscus sabdariffa TaxID=183260 RepID=A0ABR2CD39_9ROSI
MSYTAGSDECLDWNTRYKVATGIAEGLKYLHHDCPRRFIHRDITASNILLNQDYEARVRNLHSPMLPGSNINVYTDFFFSDFGLAKWLPENWPQHIVHPIEGTFGYLAPEYFMHGIVNEKTDVFAFGVLLLEILTGRRAVESGQSLLIWGKPFLEKNQVKELVDPRLEDNYDQTEVKRAMLTPSLCINHLAKLRPSMKRVVALLKNEDGPVNFELPLFFRFAKGGGCVTSDVEKDATTTSQLRERATKNDSATNLLEKRQGTREKRAPKFLTDFVCY